MGKVKNETLMHPEITFGLESEKSGFFRGDIPKALAQ